MRPANRQSERGRSLAHQGPPLYSGAASPTEEKQAGHWEASMDALALVVWTVTFLSATVMFFCGALIVVLRMRRRRAAAVRWALQRAGRELEAIPPRSHIRAGAVPMLVGVALGGVIVLSTYLYVAYQSRPALLLGMGILLLVAARLRRARPGIGGRRRRRGSAQRVNPGCSLADASRLRGGGAGLRVAAWPRLYTPRAHASSRRDPRLAFG